MQFYIFFFFICTSHKNKNKKFAKLGRTFLTDSPPGYVVKILVNLSLNDLIKKVLINEGVYQRDGTGQ